MFNLNSLNAEMIQNGATTYGSGSAAMIAGLAAVVIATRAEQIDALMTPAAKRPKAKDIQVAVRLAFGGDSKDVDRGRYELCGLAFRVMSKLEKEHEAVLLNAVQTREPGVLAADLMRLSDHDTVQALAQWVAAAAKAPVEKTVIEKVMAYLEKNDLELSSADLTQIATYVAAGMAKRTRIAADLVTMKDAA